MVLGAEANYKDDMFVSPRRNEAISTAFEIAFWIKILRTRIFFAGESDIFLLMCFDVRELTTFATNRHFDDFAIFVVKSYFFTSGTPNNRRAEALFDSQSSYYTHRRLLI